MLRFFRQGHRKEASPKVPSLHYNWVFFMALDGPVSVMTSRGKLPPPESQRLWMFAPERPHCFVCGPETERIVFAFSTVGPLLEKLAAQSGSLSIALSDSEIAHWREFGQEIGQHFMAPSMKSLLIFEKALNELSLLLVRDMDFEPFSPLTLESVERVERAIGYYTEHLKERPKLPQVAASAGVSVAHLRRLFHEVFSKSPSAILTRLRLEQAVQRLLTTTDTMETIAENCGFQSASQLARAFQKYYGCSPNAWRHYVSPLAKKRGKNEHAELTQGLALRKFFP